MQALGNRDEIPQLAQVRKIHTNKVLQNRRDCIGSAPCAAAIIAAPHSTRSEEPLMAEQNLKKPSSPANRRGRRSEEHTSELQLRLQLVCRLLLEKKKTEC